MNSKEVTGPGFCEGFSGDMLVSAANKLLDKVMAWMEEKDGIMEKYIAYGIYCLAILYLFGSVLRVL